MNGLSEQAVQVRRANGQGNQMDWTPSRTYLQIFWQNLFRFVNLVLLALGALLVILGSPADAITTAGLVTMNVGIGVVQEFRAKRKLDQIALLTRPQVTVIREGEERNIDPTELVVDDLVIVAAGDQLMTDGELVGDGKIEVDESLLTGESDTIPKQNGDEVLAGSFCATGQAVYQVTKVGQQSLANRITAKARHFQPHLTPLQQDVNLWVRLVALVGAILGGLIYIQMLREGATALERVQMAAVVMGSIPQGLIFLVTLAYALGAVRIAGRGALVQQSNAVESMSNVTVLCLDKTGTLTTNRITLEALHPLAADKPDLERHLGQFAASVSHSNKTNQALKTAYPHSARQTSDEVAFSSARKWSGLAFEDAVYILGAPEILRPQTTTWPDALQTQIETWSAGGFRVIVFAQAPPKTHLHGPDDHPSLPADLTILGAVCLRDELRPNVDQTLANFAQAGIALKIISGDNPQTVAALAQQVGFNTNGGAVSGSDLATLNTNDFARTAHQATIFGRITPDQKEQLVTALQAQGEYVAMIGDGVNDVLSLKQADIGIAMQSGSTAARNVADIVLMNDAFTALPQVFTEGQRIVNGILDTMRLLLSRTFQVMFIIMAASIVGVAFPLLPRQDTLNAFLAAGIPPTLLAIWAPQGQPTSQRIWTVARFIIPAALTIGLMGFAMYLFTFDQTEDVAAAQTALTLTVVSYGTLLVYFLKPPTHFLQVVSVPLARDPRPWLVPPVMITLLGGVMLVAPLREFFALTPLDPRYYALMIGGGVAWLVIFRYALAYQVTRRFLGRPEL